MKSLSLSGVTVSYRDAGRGPPVLLAHCSSATHREWSFLAEEIGGRHRIIAPDFIGYGRSESWPDSSRMPYDADIRVVEALLDEVKEPVRLIGHSYGAAMCLEAARRDVIAGRDRVRSMLLIEPVSFHLLRTGGRGAEWRQISDVATACIDFADNGRPVKAANVYMGFWLGRLRWRLAPRKFREAVVATVAKVADEFRGIYELHATPQDYGNITCPVTLARGGRTRPPAHAVVELLLSAIGHSKLVEIPSAGHMSPYTHKTEVLKLCSEMLESEVPGR